jgi:hypothetical protein
LERALTDLRGVRGARVDVDQDGVKSIRVLVVPERDDERTERDVRRLAFSTIGKPLDPDRIQVLSATETTEDKTAQRRKLSSLTIERTGDRFSVRVTLELGGDVLVGESEGPAVSRFEQRVVARATLDGVAELLDFTTELESVEFLQVGDSEVAIAALSTPQGYLTGSAMVKLDRYEAIARATLDALNRFTIGSGDRDPV